MQNLNKIVAGIGIVGLFATLGFANASNISFEAEDELIKGCPSEIKVILDTEDEEINSSEIVFIENDSYVLNDFLSDNGVFRTYTSPKKITAETGKFKNKQGTKLAGTTGSPKGFAGEGEFGTIIVTPKSDTLTIDVYAVPGYDGDDTNVVKVVDNKASDTLNEVLNNTFEVVEGECNTENLGEINVEENSEVSVFSEEVESVVEGTTDINEKNVYDENQETSRLSQNLLYIIIIIIVIIILILIVSKKKKK